MNKEIAMREKDIIEGFGGYEPWGIKPTPGDISGDAIGVTFGMVDMP